MPRLKFVGEPAQALRRGPIWQPGEERDLGDAEAAPYLKNANWQVVQTKTETTVVDVDPSAEPTAPAEASTEETATATEPAAVAPPQGG